jgi:hypothetical protein
LTRGHKSGVLVLMPALGPSACPKNARDLTCITTQILVVNLKVAVTRDVTEW